MIQEYLAKQRLFNKKFRRSKRPKYNALANFASNKEVVEMIQEDYNDYTLSDEDLSQDSLDMILERNLILLPGAEANDMKNRKIDRKRKSTRLSANLLIEQVISVHDMIGRRGSQMLSQNMIRDDVSHDPMTLKSASGEYIFFTIDKVENFELYYPQNNVIKLITEFEKYRFEQLLESRQGIAKALVIRNFGSMLKSNRGPHKSPLFYANLTKENIIRGRKKKDTVTEKQLPVQRLKTLMDNIIHNRKKNKVKKVNQFGYENEVSEYESDTESETSFQEEKQSILIRKGGTLEQDEATIPRSDRMYERRQTNPSLHMGKLGSLVPKMMNKTSSDMQKYTSRTSSIDTPLKRFNKKDGDDDRDKQSVDSDDNHESREGKIVLQDLMVRQRNTSKTGNISQRRTSRALSQGKIDEMQRLFDKIDTNTFQKMVEAKLNKTVTANFGS